MDLSFSDEQRMLRANLSAYLRDHYAFAARRSASVSEEGWRPEFWRGLATDLDILGATLSESVGGLGGGAADQMVIVQELGGALVLEPYLECVVVAAGLLEQAGGAAADEALKGIINGEEVVALAATEASSRYSLSDVRTRAVREGNGWRLSGFKTAVTGAPWASKLIIPARTGGSDLDKDGISLFLIDRDTPGLELRAYPTIDGRRAADLAFHELPLGADALIGPEGGALPLLQNAGDRAISALSAEAVGIASFMLDTTIGYTKQRKQFDQPIASFQVLQHRMVDMYMHVEMARSAMYLATLQLDAPPDERALAASAAKVTVANACRFVGENAIQLHGGMGMTDELPLTHYFRRATLIGFEYGTVDYHLARFDELSRSQSASI